jgi:WD40 repeat protein
VIDAQSGESIRTFTPGGENLAANPGWSTNGSQVATGLFNNQIIIWDYETGERITTLVHSTAADAPIQDVEWSPDGSKFASAGCDISATAKVWDAHTWEPLFVLQHEPPTCVATASWSPDGTRLLTTAGNDDEGAKDHTARIWDAATGKELLVFNGHTKAITSGSWSADGRFVATFGTEGAVKIWNSSTGDELLTLNVPVFYYGFAQWSPDGQHLAIFGLDTLVSVWRVWQSKEELVDYAKENYIIRELTEAERQQFGLK